MHHPKTQLQKGATLIVSLIMLLVVLLLGTSLSDMTRMGEKAARNERDRQTAMHAAEAALADAEKDIEDAVSLTSRSALFSPKSAEGFTEDCGKGNNNRYQGLCATHGINQKAPWIAVDITNTSDSSPSVQFGRFTGQTMPNGGGPFPSHLPRYIIELMMDTTAGQSANAAYIYRITAVGFGSDAATRVVLQSFYRKTEI